MSIVHSRTFGQMCFFGALSLVKTSYRSRTAQLNSRCDWRDDYVIKRVSPNLAVIERKRRAFSQVQIFLDDITILNQYRSNKLITVNDVFSKRSSVVSGQSPIHSSLYANFITSSPCLISLSYTQNGTAYNRTNVINRRVIATLLRRHKLQRR